VWLSTVKFGQVLKFSINLSVAHRLACGLIFFTCRSQSDNPSQGDNDRYGFLGVVAEISERFEIDIFAYVLMDNH
jgi:hypothetical protein